MYTDRLCKPNQHAIVHLADCLRDFGPAHAQWTYPYERLNGIMGTTPMNRHAVEMQFGRHWSRITTLHVAPTLCNMPLSDKEAAVMESLLGSVRSADRGCSGSAMMCSFGLQRAQRVTGLEKFDAAYLLSRPAKDKKEWFPPSDFRTIAAELKERLGGGYKDVSIRPTFLRGQRLQLYGDVLGTNRTRFARSANVLAHVAGRSRPAQCLFFLDVGVTLLDEDGAQSSGVLRLAKVRWYDRYCPKSDKSEGKDEIKDWKEGPLGDTLDRWWMDLQDGHDAAADRPSCWLPIHRILCRFVLAPCSQDDKPELKKRRKADGPRPLQLKLFRTCPLPMQLPL